MELAADSIVESVMFDQMIDLVIPRLKDVFVSDLAEQGHWIVANLETNLSWPVEYQKYNYQGADFFIIPITKESYPAIAIKNIGYSDQEARSTLLRFISAVSWSESSGIIVVGFTGGNLPRPLAREKSFGLTITRDLNLTYLPEPSEDRGRLALALMREGRGLNHPAYAFLSFYRVLEAAMPKGKQRRSWIVDKLDSIFDRRGIEALAALRASGITDIDEHLYNSGRKAIAHAQSDPIINPDEAADYERIATELPIMRGLAELAIEDILQIKTRHTIWREHLYELDGFKKSIDDEQISKILQGQIIKTGESVELPIIDVELRRSAKFRALRKMRPHHVAQQGKRLQVVYRSPDDLVEMIFILDFENERLIFDWQRGLVGRDDGSPDAANHAAELNRFVLEYVGNGELHLFDSETSKLLSRLDAFIPTNYWGNHEVLNRQIQEWTEEAERRKSANPTEG